MGGEVGLGWHPGIRRAWLPPAEARKGLSPLPRVADIYNEIQTIRPRAEGRNGGAWAGALVGERGAAGGL